MAEREKLKSEDEASLSEPNQSDNEEASIADDDSEQAQDKEEPPKSRKVHKLSLNVTEDFNAKLRKRGIIYVARIPPRMNPSKIKTLLQDFGEVTRVYLVEEDKTVRKRRQKALGGGGKRYVEGWVEFKDKRIAKSVAQHLNNTPISNHKRNVHFGDLWNVKYLRKFQWSHLTEKVAYERRVREQKLRVEMMQARRENAAYKELVETGNKLDKIEERKRKRGETVMSETNKRPLPRQTKPVEEYGSKKDKAAKSAILEYDLNRQTRQPKFSPQKGKEQRKGKGQKTIMFRFGRFLTLVFFEMLLVSVTTALRGFKGRLSGPWPECFNNTMTGEDCVDFIENDSPDLTGNVIVVGPGDMMLRNYDLHRVYVLVDENDVVSQVPNRGVLLCAQSTATTEFALCDKPVA